MPIDPIDEYEGDVPLIGQDAETFSQNAQDCLTFQAKLPIDLNVMISQINATIEGSGITGNYIPLTGTTTGNELTGTIDTDFTTSMDFVTWDGSYETSKIRLYDSGGIAFGVDGVYFIHVGEHFSEMASYYNPAVNTDDIVMTADGRIVLTTNATSTGVMKQFVHDTTGAFYAPNGVYDGGTRVYSAANNNIGTGATNYAAGNHTHEGTGGTSGDYLPLAGGTMTGTITYDLTDGDSIVEWDGAYETSKIRLYDSGGIAFGVDGMYFVHVGEHYSNMSSYYNPAANIDDIVMTADGRVILTTNATSIGVMKQFIHDTTGAFYAPNGVYDGGTRVYSAANNNIGTGATNYAAGNHTHTASQVARGIKTISASTYTITASDFGKVLIFTAVCVVTIPAGLSGITGKEIEMLFNLRASYISGPSVTFYAYNRGYGSDPDTGSEAPADGTGNVNVAGVNKLKVHADYQSEKLICTGTNSYVAVGAMFY